MIKDFASSMSTSSSNGVAKSNPRSKEARKFSRLLPNFWVMMNLQSINKMLRACTDMVTTASAVFHRLVRASQLLKSKEIRKFVKWVLKPKSQITVTAFDGFFSA
ncbi:hypothetical protein WN943_023786 [Citrus x changshan-huyou]